MPRYNMVSAATLEDVDDFFAINNSKSDQRAGAACSDISQLSIGTLTNPANGYALPTEIESHNDRIKGRMIDEDGNIIGPDSFLAMQSRSHQKPSYLLETEQYSDGMAYVDTFQRRNAHSLHYNMNNLAMDETATIEGLETRSMTGSTISSRLGAVHGLMPTQDARVAYTGYRQTVYDEKLPITRHRDRIINTIETTQCTVIQGMTGCGKTTQVPQYILDEYARTGRRCKIAVTQPRRIAAISIAKRVCHERGWTEGTYCGYQVARDTKFDVEKTMITYMTTGILLQKLINEKNLNTYTHIILDEVHERDQDTDLALLIVRKFIRTVSPQVKVVLMSATFDCQIFARYFATEIRGDLQYAPVIDVEGRSYKVSQFHWSDSHLSNMVPIPRFEEDSPTVYPEAFSLVVKLMYEFDKIETEEQAAQITEGKPVSRGSVLIFLPGLAEIQDLSAQIQRDEMLQTRKLDILPLHSSITLEEQARVFETPHVYHRKVILSTNIAESSITVPDVKYVIDFCLTKNIQTDRDTNMTCLKMNWASKANCKQRMGRAGRVSNGRVYRLVHKAFFMNHMQDYGVPEMKRCPLSQLILRVKKLGPEEPRATFSMALDPPEMGEIGKSILLLKEAGALADPDDPRRYNPFDGQLTFVGEVLASLPLNIELGKLLVFGHMLGLLPECLIIAAAMHTRPIFQQPFNKHVETFRHKLKWDRGMHSDPIATVNAFKEWDRLREQEFFMRAKHAETKWCRDNYLQRKTLHEVREVIADLTLRLAEHGISPKSVRAPHLRRERETDPAQEQLLLKVALACAFYPHYFTHQVMPEEDAVRTLSGKSPLTAVYMKGLPNNQGILYKRQIEQMISDHVPGCKLQASFENTKCYLEFEHAPGDCGRIPNALYVSLHMTQLKDRLELRLFDDIDALQKMQEITSIQKAAALRDRRLDTNRLFHSKDRISGASNISHHTLPGNMITIIELFVVFVEECGHFWAHEVDKVKEQQLLKLQEDINNPANIRNSAVMMNPVVGVMCIAPYENQWFRARVQALRGDSVLIFFVDYGNRDEIQIGRIRQLLPQFRDMEFQAIECMLTHMCPPRMMSSYPPAINQAFSQLIHEKNIYACIYSVDKGVLRLRKVVDVEQQNVELHDIIYDKGMASKCEETLTSIQNHRVRYPEAGAGISPGASAPGDSLGAQAAGGEGWGFGLDDDGPRLRKSHRRQKISGPFSPIEMKFFSMSITGNTKEVRVDPNSVNSIALDEEPGDKKDRLMVSATQSVNPAGNRIIARETTLLPNIHGLPSLMCLLWAPSIQIRRDPQKKCYTGAICGLGRDPRTGGSAFPDHDMEIEFDTHIDVEDILKINKIRMSFNYCLGGTRVDENNMAKFQKNIRSIIKELLKRSREPKDKTHCIDQRLQWVELEEHDVLKHELEDTAADEVHLFRLIKPPVLESDTEAQAEMSQIEYLKSHCKGLTKLAATSQPRALDNIICELCSVRVSNTRELWEHLQGRMHRSHEYSLFRDDGFNRRY